MGACYIEIILNLWLPGLDLPNLVRDTGEHAVRPSTTKDAKDVRHTRTIRLSTAEEKIIQAAAAVAELPTATLLRAAGLAAATEVVVRSGRIEPDHDDDREGAA